MNGRLSDVRNFREVSDQLATGGQPNEAQLADAASVGVTFVINLALHDDPRYSLKDEAGCVRELGMEYVHIPVPFEGPTEESLMKFFDAMDRAQDRKTLVHCAANMRVTAFLGLYRVIRQGWTRDKAFDVMKSVWQPDELWQTFIDSMIARHGVSG